MNRLLHILIVEDDESFRAALAGVLTHFGHTVCSVADGESINRILYDYPFDCILLDQSLGGENGIALARRLALRGTMYWDRICGSSNQAKCCRNCIRSCGIPSAPVRSGRENY